MALQSKKRRVRDRVAENQGHLRTARFCMSAKVIKIRNSIDELRKGNIVPRLVDRLKELAIYTHIKGRRSRQDNMSPNSIRTPLLWLLKAANEHIKPVQNSVMTFAVRSLLFCLPVLLQ